MSICTLCLKIEEACIVAIFLHAIYHSHTSKGNRFTLQYLPAASPAFFSLFNFLKKNHQQPTTNGFHYCHISPQNPSKECVCKRSFLYATKFNWKNLRRHRHVRTEGQRTKSLTKRIHMINLFWN